LLRGRVAVLSLSGSPELSLLSLHPAGNIGVIQRVTSLLKLEARTTNLQRQRLVSNSSLKFATGVSNSEPKTSSTALAQTSLRGPLRLFWSLSDDPTPTYPLPPLSLVFRVASTPLKRRQCSVTSRCTRSARSYKRQQVLKHMPRLKFISCTTLKHDSLDQNYDPGRRLYT
jgi:hypothetical protein